MATDRIGIGRRTGDIAGALMSSGTKRKVEELGGHVLSAAVGDVVARTMSAAVGRYEARASVGDQLERLGMLLIMVHSAVEGAEGVHIRSWWLRRWLWRLRDAAIDGDEVLRQSLRQRWRGGGAEDAASTDTNSTQVSGNWLWNAARRVFRSAKTLLFADDSSSVRLSGAVARLERVSMGLPEFLKLLDMEICRSLPPLAVAPASVYRISLRSSSGRDKGEAKDPTGRSDEYSSSSSSSSSGRECDKDEAKDPTGRHNINLVPIKEEILHGVLDVPPRCRCTSRHTLDRQDVSRSDDDDESLTSRSLDVSYSSYVYTATRRRIGQLIVLQPTPRPVGKLVMPTVADIRRVLRASDRAEVHGKRWLAEWHRELQAVADRANREPKQTAIDGATSYEMIDDDVKRTAESVQTAADGLECFVRLVRIAIVRASFQDKQAEPAVTHDGILIYKPRSRR